MLPELERFAAASHLIEVISSDGNLRRSTGRSSVFRLIAYEFPIRAAILQSSSRDALIATCAGILRATSHCASSQWISCWT